MNELRKRIHANFSKLTEIFQKCVIDSQKTGVFDNSELLSEYSKVMARVDEAISDFEARNKKKNKSFFNWG